MGLLIGKKIYYKIKIKFFLSLHYKDDKNCFFNKARNSKCIGLNGITICVFSLGSASNKFTKVEMNDIT